MPVSDQGVQACQGWKKLRHRRACLPASLCRHAPLPCCDRGPQIAGGRVAEVPSRYCSLQSACSKASCMAYTARPALTSQGRQAQHSFLGTAAGSADALHTSADPLQRRKHGVGLIKHRLRKPASRMRRRCDLTQYCQNLAFNSQLSSFGWRSTRAPWGAQPPVVIGHCDLPSTP